MKNYEVTFNHGVHRTIIVEAESREDAMKKGLEAYRKRATAVDNFSTEFIVNDAYELKEENN